MWWRCLVHSLSLAVIVVITAACARDEATPTPLATATTQVQSSAPTPSPSPPPPTPNATTAPPVAPTATSVPPTPPAPSPSPAATPRANLDAVRIAVERVTGGLQGPVHVTHAGDGSGRLFVVEKPGVIRIVKDGQVLATPFLDIQAQVGSRASEQGLLSVAFHPDYKRNGYFFVNYTDTNGDTVVERYHVSQDPDRADAASRHLILTLDQPFANHNGGYLLFGPDGYLWIGTGDGGSGGDPRGNAQNGQSLLGKMLRLDVDRGDPYAIPPDNPFRNDARTRPEIWALGLRNPWRYTFDRVTGDFFIADVGQNRYEEVNVAPLNQPGLNYGWNIMEGRHCFRPTEGCSQEGLVLPVAEYGRDRGCSITGGHVYRGQRFPALAGIYFFGDFCSGRIWGLARGAAGDWQMRELLKTSLRITSLGEDENGELYLTSLGSDDLHRLIQP